MALNKFFEAFRKSSVEIEDCDSSDKILKMFQAKHRPLRLAEMRDDEEKISASLHQSLFRECDSPKLSKRKSSKASSQSENKENTASSKKNPSRHASTASPTNFLGFRPSISSTPLNTKPKSSSAAPKNVSDINEEDEEDFIEAQGAPVDLSIPKEVNEQDEIIERIGCNKSSHKPLVPKPRLISVDEVEKPKKETKKLKQTKIKMPIKKKKSNLKAPSGRPGTPVEVYGKNHKQFKEMEMIASDSENGSIPSHVADRIRQELDRMYSRDAEAPLEDELEPEKVQSQKRNSLAENESVRKVPEIDQQQQVEDEIEIVQDEIEIVEVPGVVTENPDSVEVEVDERDASSDQIEEDDSEPDEEVSSKPPAKRTKLSNFLFDNDENSDRFIKYDPKDRGCQREGLRVRRYAQPWWIHDGSEKFLAVEYCQLSEKEMNLKMKNEQRLVNLMKKNHVTQHMLMPSMAVELLKPEENIKRMKLLLKEQKKLAKIGLKRKSMKNDYKDFIKNVVNKKVQKDPSNHSIQNGTHSIENMEFQSMGEGVASASYLQTNSIIKINPGCSKKKTKVNQASIAIFMLAGHVEIIKSEETVELLPFQIHNILSGDSYMIKNLGAEHAVFIYNRNVNIE